MPLIVGFTLSAFCYAFWAVMGLALLRAALIIADVIIKIIAGEVIKEFWPAKKAGIEDGQNPPIWLYTSVLLSLIVIACAFFWKGWKVAGEVAGGIMLGGIAIYFGFAFIVAAYHGAIATCKGVRAGNFNAIRNALLWSIYLALVAIWWLWRGIAGGISATILFAIGFGVLWMLTKAAISTYRGLKVGEFIAFRNTALTGAYLIVVTASFAFKGIIVGFSALFYLPLAYGIVWLFAKWITRLTHFMRRRQQA